MITCTSSWDKAELTSYTQSVCLHRLVTVTHALDVAIDGLRETINQLTPGVNRPEVKSYAYCHTFCGHELELQRDVSTADKMVQSCCAFGCTNRSGEGKVERRTRWIAAVRREDWQPNQHSRICSAHFVTVHKF